MTLTTGGEIITLADGFRVRRLPSQTQRFVYSLGQRYSTGDSPQTVSVLDTATNTMIAAIPVGRGCWCVGADRIAVAPDGASVYVTNDGDNTVSIIDT